MQGDNGVRSTVSDGDQESWSSAFTNELIQMIKSAHRTQVAFVAHVNQVAADAAIRHEKYPYLSKQQLSKRLKKPTPDWPLANMIIKCCTHDDAAATSHELARLAGFYEAATGSRPKGYAGPLIKPVVLPAAVAGEPVQREVQALRDQLVSTKEQLAGCRGELAAREIDQRELRTLRVQLAGTHKLAVEYRNDLVARNREVELLSRQARTSSSAQMSAQGRLTRAVAEVEQLRVQLSDTTALYQDQVARSTAFESRLHTLWERYALLNASRETTPGQSVITLGTTAMNPGGRTWQVDPDAPASRRVLAVYLQSYRELAERSLAAIVEFTGFGREQLTAILRAETAPSLETVLAVAAAITAPAETVRRLHATMADDPSVAGRPVASPPESFEEIVAAMVDPATVAAGCDGPFPATVARPVAPAAGRPVAVSPFAATSPPAVGWATVSGDSRVQQALAADAARLAVRHRRRTVAVIAATTVALWTVITFVLFKTFAIAAPFRDLATWQVIFTAGMAALTLIAVLVGATTAVRRAGRRLTRQFYRGRHTRYGTNNERLAPRPAPVATVVPGYDMDDTQPIFPAFPYGPPPVSSNTMHPALGRSTGGDGSTLALGLYGDSGATASRATARGIARVPVPAIPQPRAGSVTPVAGTVVPNT
jgi:hypothetical protein